MKCNSCGANIAIENQFCPHCGTPNEEAKKHIEAMNHYNKEFLHTKENVLTQTKRWTGIPLYIAVISVLLLFNAIVLLCYSNLYYITDVVQEAELNRNEKLHRQRLDYYEENQQYYQFSSYYSYHDLYKLDSLTDYSAISEAARGYQRAYESILRLNNPKMDKYTTQHDNIQTLSLALEQICKMVNQDYYIKTEENFSNAHVASIEKMYKNLSDMLIFYCNLTDEDIRNLPVMTKTEIISLLGKRMGLYE